jgi:diacylglycerol kinase (ATP)
MKALILVNPVSGGGRARRVMPEVAAYLQQQGFAAEIAESSSGADLEKRAGEGVCAGFEPIVTAGGDGAVQHVARGTLGLGAKLGILPLGGGNDVARALGVPSDPIDAARTLIRGTPRAMDVVRVRLADSKETLYLGGGGMGLDADAGKWANGPFRKLPGAARYIAGALWALKSFRPFRVAVTLEDQAEFWSEPLLIASVANTPHYGGGVTLAPDARIDDGLLDVVLIRRMSLGRLLELIPVALGSGRIGSPDVERHRAGRIRLRAERAMDFHGDGEILGDAPVELESLPGAIRVLVPAAN